MKHLLPQTNYYRANLHCHSTISDGAFSKEELKQIYKSRGYQILAITDHNLTIPHPELEDEDFLLITANEINIDERTPIGPYGKTYHLNLYAKQRNSRWQPALPQKIYSEEGAMHAQLARFADLPFRYDVESVNKIIAAANENGFLVCYNHPTWSMQSYPDYAGLKGLWGVELYNTCTCLGGCDENNNRVYQDDSTATYAWLTAEALNLRHYHLAFGASGLTRSGNGGAPKCGDAYPYCFEGAPVTYDHPDYVMINHGANDRKHTEEEYITEYRALIAQIRKAHPDAKIICLSAFCVAFPKAIAAMVEDINKTTGDDIFFIDSAGWVPAVPLHPTRNMHATIAEKLIPILKERYGL